VWAQTFKGRSGYICNTKWCSIFEEIDILWLGTYLFSFLCVVFNDNNENVIKLFYMMTRLTIQCFLVFCIVFNEKIFKNLKFFKRKIWNGT
jgi:small basic protein